MAKYVLVFFFQAEDGIRDIGVTGVQTCALPIFLMLCESETFAILNEDAAALLAPYAFAPLTLSVLLGRNHGLYAAVFVALWTRLLFGAFDPPLLACALVCGFTAVFLTLQVRRRSRLVRAGFWVGVALWLLALTFGLI